MKHLFDVAFQGGGARGLVLNGALERLEEDGHSVRRVIGTSAGAIAATLTAAGFSGAELVAISRARQSNGLPEFAEYVSDPPEGSADEVRRSGLYQILLEAEQKLHVPSGIADTVALHLGGLLSSAPGVRPVFSFVEYGGIHTGLGFTAWLSRTLERKHAGLSKLTLGEFARLTGRDLTIVASDTTAMRMLLLNHRTAPQVPLVAAVRMSMSIPLFFDEVEWLEEWGAYLGEDIRGHIVVDGGLLSNFPLRYVLPDSSESVHLFMGEPPTQAARPLGLHIDPELAVHGAPPQSGSVPNSIFARLGHTRLARRLHNLIETATDGNDDTLEETHGAVICKLPAGGYSSTEFHMEAPRVEALLAVGRESMEGYLVGLSHA